MKGEILIEQSKLNPKWYITFTTEYYKKPEFICTGCEERYNVDRSSADGVTPVMASCVNGMPCPFADALYGERTPARFEAYKQWAAFANQKVVELNLE